MRNEICRDRRRIYTSGRVASATSVLAPALKAPSADQPTARFMAAFAKLDAEIAQAGLKRFARDYGEVVGELREMTTVIGYKRPTASRAAHPFTQQRMPEIRRDKFEDGVILSKDDFAKAARGRPSPFETADADAACALDLDLRLAIDFVTEHGSDVPKRREARLAKLKRLASRLEPMRDAIDACKSAEARAIASRFNVAWTAATIDALEWPDVDLPVRFVKGFNVIFDIPDSGVFRADYQPAEISREKFEAANSRMVANISSGIERAASGSDVEQKERYEQCWARTKEEIEEGLVARPRSRARMDRKYKRGKWRCLGRSAIKQKGKWRCIDNGKKSKHNRGTTMRERITCGRADFPVVIAREFARRARARRAAGAKTGIFKRSQLRMRHGTNDLRAAYRHVPTRQPQYTCVAVWNADKKRVEYCDVPGHNFGLKSAVVNFNRFPELSAAVARRLLWVVTEHYYDDNDTAEPECASDSGQRALIDICGDEFFGFPFDERKHEDMRGSNEYLGVLSDVSGTPQGTLRVDVTRKRRDKIKALIGEIRKKRKLSSGMAGSLFGKSRCLLSPCFSSVGKACLRPIKAREYQRARTDIDTELDDSLEFIELVCDRLPATKLPVLPSRKEKVVIFTDAEGSQRDGEELPSGHLGFVVYHPVHGRRYAHAAAPPDWVALFDAIKKRDTYIGQYELAAAITPFLSLPKDWFEGYPVELWIDNSGAVGALIKGYSGVPDCAKIVNLFHFTIARLGIESLWIDYVPTQSNPADVPSRRHEMDDLEASYALRTFGTEVPMRLPVFADTDGEWLPAAVIAKATWR